MTERRSTYRATTRLVQAGALVPTPCERCGTEHNIEGHHDSYDSPVVRWLCGSCHQIHHRGAPNRDELVSSALFLLGEGLGEITVAQALGITRSTMYGWFKRPMRRPEGGWFPEERVSYSLPLSAS